MKNHYKIVVPAYNAHPWIERCLASIAAQTYPRYDVVLVDDASTDPHHLEVLHRYVREHGFHLHTRTENGGPLAALIDGTEASHPIAEDVIVVVDGDDWLANEWVLEKLDAYYAAHDPYLTYGSYLRYKEGVLGHTRTPPRRVRWRRSYRQYAWLFSHLRTYKYFLWEAIQPNDLLDTDGKPLRSSGDLATMLPMAEMAGRHILHIPEVLYIYNDTNPASDYRVRLAEQQRCVELVRSRERYDVLVR